MSRHIRNMAVIVSLLLALPALSLAQFSSGSTGADGPYSPTVSGVFNPAALGINPAGDNIFNFTTINIPAGVTISMPASIVRNMPVVWLATGNVTIAGTINLAGDPGYTVDGANSQEDVQVRREAQPGAGGYYGGLGSHGGVGPEAGAGPGGGPGGLNSSTGYQCWGGTGASYSAGLTTPYSSGTGQTYGGPYLVPLYGGSGGGGGWGSNAVNAVGGGGGAGGGAIRITSTTQITLTGSINASGGNGGFVTNPNGSCPGGPGAGGSVNLIAPTISGNGSIYVTSGYNLSGNSSNATYTYVSNGIVRFNVTNYGFTGTILGGSFTNGVSSGDLFVGPLFNVPSNTVLAQPTLTITQVNGVNVPQPPQGLYLNPDVQINANTPVTVSIAATNVPVGTVTPILRVTSETSGDQSITCSTLTGTLAASTGTCTATFPFSISIAELRVTF